MYRVTALTQIRTLEFGVHKKLNTFHFDKWLPEFLQQAVQSWRKSLDPVVGRK
jgi:hypothetical protein